MGRVWNGTCVGPLSSSHFSPPPGEDAPSVAVGPGANDLLPPSSEEGTSFPTTRSPEIAQGTGVAGAVDGEADDVGLGP